MRAAVYVTILKEIERYMYKKDIMYTSYTSQYEKVRQFLSLSLGASRELLICSLCEINLVMRNMYLMFSTGNSRKEIWVLYMSPLAPSHGDKISQF